MDRDNADGGLLPGGSSFAAVNAGGAKRVHDNHKSDERQTSHRRLTPTAMYTSSSNDAETSAPETNTNKGAAGPGPADGHVSTGSAAASASAHQHQPDGLLPRRRTRNRPAKSCVLCRQRKVKCDRGHPCATCMAINCEQGCVYASAPPRPHAQPTQQQALPLPLPLPPVGTGPFGPKYGDRPIFSPEQHQLQQQQPQHHVLPRTGFGSGHGEGQPGVDGRAYAGTSSLNASSAYAPPHGNITGSNGLGVGSNGDTIFRLQSVIEQLEQHIAQQGTLVKQLQEDRVRNLSDKPNGDNGSGRPAEPEPSGAARGVMSKSRYFGQSHWMNGISFFPLITGVVKKLHKDQDQAYLPFMTKCKNLAKSIKQSRVGTMLELDVGKSMPHEESVIRPLLEAYFRTFETVYRILHVPTFWHEYSQYREEAAAASPTFIIQMQLCMAIGTCFQEDVVGLRHMASQWIYEAQLWLAPPEKSRMTFAALQIMCLLHLARETCGIGGDFTWISSGSLMLCAMYMGLHHDPGQLDTNMSDVRAELRRRLWATILEIALQSSLDSGAPPLISPSDYDTKPPANFDDDQLTNGEGAPITPRPPGCFTETSVQLTLLRSFPTRLAVAQYVNGFNASASYEQISRLNAQLQHQVSATLHYDPAGVLPRRMTLFQHRLAEHMVHRFLLALNQPCLGQARINPDYWFARKACVESSRKLCEGFSKATSSSADAAGTSTTAVDDFGRLSLAGAGAFRSVPVQCMMVIGVELLWQALDDRSVRLSAGGAAEQASPSSMSGAGSAMGAGVAPRGELMDLLQCCVKYQRMRISCGETNVKGYMISSALVAHIEALFRGAPDEELQGIVLESLRTSLQHCWELLKEVAGDRQTPPVSVEMLAADWGEAPAGGQGVGDVLGFGNGWDWDWEDEQDLNFSFDFLGGGEVDASSFSFN